MPTNIGIYIHIPFCQARCSYCDFNTYSGLSHLMDEYVKALCQEIETYCCQPEWIEGEQDKRVRAVSVYLGGGTPSLLSAVHLESIFNACHATFAIADNAEITIEANPGTVGRDSLKAMYEMGINRLSLGVQSFDDVMLHTLGRLHSVVEAREAYETARHVGFDNINLDLMYGLPGQSLAHWRQMLTEALILGPEHLSLYALTVEEHTPMEQYVSAGEATLPDDDVVADMYTLAEDVLQEAGYIHYEISNWAARPELASRHNMIYWRRQPYLGFGAGAHSFDGQWRWSNVPHPQDYIERIRNDGSAVAEKEAITPEMAMAETMFLGLRLLEDGISTEEFARRHGQSLDIFAQQIDELVQLGLLERTERGVRLTRRGRLLSNQVFIRFLPRG